MQAPNAQPCIVVRTQKRRFLLCAEAKVNGEREGLEANRRSYELISTPSCGLMIMARTRGFHKLRSIFFVKCVWYTSYSDGKRPFPYCKQGPRSTNHIPITAGKTIELRNVTFFSFVQVFSSSPKEKNLSKNFFQSGRPWLITLRKIREGKNIQMDFRRFYGWLCSPSPAKIYGLIEILCCLVCSMAFRKLGHQKPQMPSIKK